MERSGPFGPQDLRSFERRGQCRMRRFTKQGQLLGRAEGCLGDNRWRGLILDPILGGVIANGCRAGVVVKGVELRLTITWMEGNEGFDVGFDACVTLGVKCYDHLSILTDRPFDLRR